MTHNIDLLTIHNLNNENADKNTNTPILIPMPNSKTKMEFKIKGYVFSEHDISDNFVEIILPYNYEVVRKGSCGYIKNNNHGILEAYIHYNGLNSYIYSIY